MSNTTRRRAERRRTTHRHWLAVVGFAAVIAGVTLAAAVDSEEAPASASIARTGETNSMGMPVIETTGAASGTATTDGVAATPQRWMLGHVPLNVAVRPTWELLNTDDHAITLGAPHVQINAGCCPGELTYSGSPTLDPDQTTQLTFELSMHPGMDGPHDMTLHVPVQHVNGSASMLELAVTGDFSD
jgi:hypothetical protein